MALDRLQQLAGIAQIVEELACGKPPLASGKAGVAIDARRELQVHSADAA
jgi:hypothetical protein